MVLIDCSILNMSDNSYADNIHLSYRGGDYFSHFIIKEGWEGMLRFYSNNTSTIQS
ncbi:hypothetical protein EV198_1300 [Roseivirga ehrenbergii]|nr:hypothetical protein EV198_1300 [Roseivirga ehrenbergii]